jgi:hypothetical protein
MMKELTSYEREEMASPFSRAGFLVKTQKDLATLLGDPEVVYALQYPADAHARVRASRLIKCVTVLHSEIRRWANSQ